jgi:hypothetical protein
MPSVMKALGSNGMFYGDFAVAGETRLGVDLDNARYDIGTLLIVSFDWNTLEPDCLEKTAFRME